MPAISNDWAPELKPEYKKNIIKNCLILSDMNMPQEKSFHLPMIYLMHFI